MKVSLIIPAYNEERTIRDVIIGAQKHVGEVIVVVSKKSTDATFKIAQESGVKTVYDDASGKGAALKQGVELATGDVIVFIDSDKSHNPEDIPKLLQLLKTNEADLVVGSRASGGSEELHGTVSEFMRNTGGALVMLCINYSFNVRFTDCENGFRAIRKEVFEKLRLRATGFDIEQEMFIKAIKQGFRVVEVPVHEYKRAYGESRLNLLKSGWKFVWCLRHLL